MNEDRKCVYKFPVINTKFILYIYILLKYYSVCKYQCKITCLSILHFKIFDQISSVQWHTIIIQITIYKLQVIISFFHIKLLFGCGCLPRGTLQQCISDLTVIISYHHYADGSYADDCRKVKIIFWQETQNCLADKTRSVVRNVMESI